MSTQEASDTLWSPAVCTRAASEFKYPATAAPSAPLQLSGARRVSPNSHSTALPSLHSRKRVPNPGQSLPLHAHILITYSHLRAKLARLGQAEYQRLLNLKSAAKCFSSKSPRCLLGSPPSIAKRLLNMNLIRGWVHPAPLLRPRDGIEP